MATTIKPCRAEMYQTAMLMVYRRRDDKLDSKHFFDNFSTQGYFYIIIF